MKNEPAFPFHETGESGQRTGMTLRDYFAAKAMQGFAADLNASWSNGTVGMAEHAYQWADAMLKARNDS